MAPHLLTHSIVKHDNSDGVKETKETNGLLKTANHLSINKPILDFSREYPDEYFNIQKGFFLRARTKELIFAVQYLKSDFSQGVDASGPKSHLFPKQFDNNSASSASPSSLSIHCNYYCPVPPSTVAPVWLRLRVSYIHHILLANVVPCVMSHLSLLTQRTGSGL
jgi:hypothetical protein